jgi:hypothetical protein
MHEVNRSDRYRLLILWSAQPNGVKPACRKARQ